MSMPKALSNNRQFQTVTVITSILILFYLVVNLLVIGGDTFVYQLNTFLVSPLSILTSGMALLLWRQMKAGAQSQYIWGGLLIGWICWAIAELLWAFYSLKGLDPYPSMADFFFLLGYIPLSIGFLSRIRNLPKRPDKFQNLVLGFVSITAGFATFTYIFIPILQSYDPERFLESVLGLFYPLADLLLLVVVLRIFFTFSPGNYGMAWRLILIGFITVTISDLVFSYADWNDLYYPDSKATFISTIGVDWLYNISYVCWAFGIYGLRILLSEHEIRRVNFQPQPVPNTYVLIFTDKDGRVGGVSQNYHRLFPVKDMMRKSLADIIGISEQNERHIQEQLRTNKKFHEEGLRITGISGFEYDARISGLAIISPPNQYDGGILLLRLYTEDGEVNYGLSEYHMSLVSNILNKVGNSEKMEISRFFYDYYLTLILSLYNLVLQEGGTPTAQSFLDELQTVSKANGWGIVFEPQMNWDSNRTAHLELPYQAWHILLETAKKFTSQLTDTERVNAAIQETRIQLSEAVLTTAARLDSLLNVQARL
jgi:hypothetical protein